MNDIFSVDDNSTPLTEEEKKSLKARWITTRGELNKMETQGILDAENWLLTVKKNILDEKFLRTLHKKMFCNVWEWAGSYRKTERNIGVAPYQIQIELRKLFDDVKYWIENKIYNEKEKKLWQQSYGFVGIVGIRQGILEVFQLQAGLEGVRVLPQVSTFGCVHNKFL